MVVKAVIQAYSYVMLWMSISIAVILFNKVRRECCRVAQQLVGTGGSYSLINPGQTRSQSMRLRSQLDIDKAAHGSTSAGSNVTPQSSRRHDQRRVNLHVPP